MVDRPDFSPSRGVDIIASSIDSLPIDIVSDSIGELAVDVAAQSAGALDINIDGQTGDIDVNLASQAGTVGIDVEAQTIGDLGIDIATQSVSQVGTRQDLDPAETINFVEIVRDTTVDDVGSGDDVFIQPPADEVWELQALRLDANPVNGASSGDHGFNVFALDGQISLVFGTSSFNQEVTWRQNYWQEADQVQEPPDVSAQGQAIQGIRLDDTTPLVVTYLNRTNSSTDSVRVIRALFRAIKVE
jgi:hypothetical protein